MPSERAGEVEEDTMRIGPENVCGFVPFPGSGAYGHWACQRRRWHLGRHRFNNYTIGQMPRFWRLRRLWRDRRTDQRMKKLGGRYGYRRTLFPTKYEPVR